MAPPTVASFQFESAAAAAHEDQVVPPVAVWRPASGDGSQRPKGGCCDGDPRGPAVSTSGTTYWELTEMRTGHPPQRTNENARN